VSDSAKSHITNSVTISSLPAISGTVTANVSGDAFTNTQGGIAADDGGGVQPNFGVQLGYFDGNDYRLVKPSHPLPISGTVTANPTGTQTIAGTVTASNLASVLASYEISAQENVFAVNASIGGQGYVSDSAKSHITNSVTIGSLPAISGTVTVGAGTAQIGSVTASISGTVPVSISSVTVGNTVTIAGTVTANPTGTQTIAGTVTANVWGKGIDGFVQLFTANNGSGRTYDGDGAVAVGFNDNINTDFAHVSTDRPFPIQGTVTVGNTVTIAGTVTANTFALQGTAVTTSNFTSTTASTVLANFNATREVLTIFNEGAGNLHIAPGATCTTIAYQVRLSSGDYYEVPNHQTTITHSAVFATAGTARVTEVS
jgi:hypothetical protein